MVRQLESAELTDNPPQKTTVQTRPQTVTTQEVAAPNLLEILRLSPLEYSAASSECHTPGSPHHFLSVQATI